MNLAQSCTRPDDDADCACRGRRLAAPVDPHLRDIPGAPTPVRLRPTKPSRVAAAAVTLVLLSLWWVASTWYGQQLAANKRADVVAQLSLRAAALQTAIGERFALLDGMVGLVQSHPSEAAMDATFNSFAASLLGSSSSNGIRNFALFPDGLGRYEYPAVNNAVPQALRNLYTTPIEENRLSVQRTLATHSVALGQPRELAQGGLGLVATQAVFVQGSLWGFVTMALDVPPILAQAGVAADDGQSPLELALADGVGHVFVGAARSDVGRRGVHAGAAARGIVAPVRGSARRLECRDDRRAACLSDQ